MVHLCVMIRFISLFFVLVSELCFAQSRFTPEALANVNSLYDEQNPIISPDGNTLYFTVVGHPKNLEGKKAVGDIWFSRWQGQNWSVPIHAGASLNASGFNSIAGFSADGNAVFLTNHYAKDKEVASQGISVSTKSENGWAFPENIRIPYFLNKSLLISGYVTEDGSILVYSAEGYETVGVEDLYVSIKGNDGSWSEPKSLGPSINSTFQELCPSLSADKTTLYFSSNKPGGFGSYDVYKSKRQDDSWSNWSTPENLGAAVNTEGRDLYFRSFNNESVTLYTATSSSNEYGDIRLFQEKAKRDTTAKTTPAIKKADSNLIKLSGQIVNSKSLMPIEALLQFKSDSIYATKSSATGRYQIDVKPRKQYTLKIEAAGYITCLEKIDLTKLDFKNIELNFKLQPIEIGASVNLKSVLFKVSETTLLAESYDELNTVVDLMRSNPKLEIELGGHTDSRGDAKLNQRLSQGRVDKVKAYLVSKGISATRIQGKGYGGKKPIAFGDSEESRRLNRRVEFIIVKD
jgi:OmpA-OmpF porin, OOP family